MLWYHFLETEVRCDCFCVTFLRPADDVFLEVEPIVRSALDGHNVCIFAYGQTGTGKTFTMVFSPTPPNAFVPRPHALYATFLWK
jgi:hypothetical protein